METIKQVFDDTAKVMLQLSDEIEELTKKFGDSSNLVTKKSEQFATLMQFYERTQTEINMYRRATHLARVVMDYKDMMLMKYSTGLSWEKVFKLHHIETEGAKALDDFDSKFKKFVEDNEKYFG